MSDKIIDLRSRAAMPEGTVFADERTEWQASVRGLNTHEFSELMAPLVADNRKGLSILPTWSRTVLYTRWLGQPI